MKSRCAFLHSPGASLDEGVGLRPVGGVGLVHHAELLRSHFELLGFVDTSSFVLSE